MLLCIFCFFFFNDTATTEIYTRSIVGSVRCVQETVVAFRKETLSIHTVSPSLINKCLIIQPGSMQVPSSAMNSSTPHLVSLILSLADILKNIGYCTCILNNFVSAEVGSKILFPFSISILSHVLCVDTCLLYTSPSPRDLSTSRMPSSA
eukprot:TRINITY_DN23407_c0_g1_i1.p1 TRINITY_DN23407_c0_g1~~TRINITY_DN23407_c0_g1_i1.p1  ORF type:complete len:150 (+),score=35.33 TRINITY_DN23407_c0_g1_i1:94-543(+)